MMMHGTDGAIEEHWYAWNGLGSWEHLKRSRPSAPVAHWGANYSEPASDHALTALDGTVPL